MATILTAEMIDSWDFSVANGEIVIFEHYLELMEGYLASETKKYSESREEAIRKGEIKVDDETGPEPDYDSYMLEVIRSTEQVLRKSLFVSLFSFLENTLVEDCRARKHYDKEIVLRLEDLTGKNDIDKVKVYWKKVLRMEFPSDTPEWSAIQNYKSLRNCIVHAGGKVGSLKENGDREKLEKFIHATATLELMSHGDIVVLKEFCDEALETIQRFLKLWFDLKRARASDIVKGG